MARISKQNESFLIRGSVVKVRRYCGKAQCRCRDGKLHETWALSYSFNGRTRMIPLRNEDVTITCQAIKRYKTLSQLELRAMRGIKQLHATIKAAKRRAR